MDWEFGSKFKFSKIKLLFLIFWNQFQILNLVRNLVLLIKTYGFQPSNLVTIEHWSKFKVFCGLGNLLVLGPSQSYNLTNDFKGFHKF